MTTLMQQTKQMNMSRCNLNWSDQNMQWQQTELVLNHMFEKRKKFYC